jgi:hypothetical protein
MRCVLARCPLQGYTVFIVDEPCFAGRDADGELQVRQLHFPTFYAETGRFTTTGSGQTRGNWFKTTGFSQANATTWPSGFKAFGDYLAERGMELGIYTDAGEYTCQGCPASAGHEAQDMATFIGWGCGNAFCLWRHFRIEKTTTCQRQARDESQEKSKQKGRLFPLPQGVVR